MSTVPKATGPVNNSAKSKPLPNRQSTHTHPLIRDMVASCEDLARTLNGRRKRRHGIAERGRYHDREVPRKERTEAIREASKTFVESLELSTGRIIDVTKGDGNGGVRNARAAEKSGLTEDRFRGALADLTSMGYVKGFQPRTEDENGRPTGLPCVRWVTEKFWRALGAWEIWKAYKNEIKIAAGSKHAPSKAAIKHATIQAKKHVAISAAADALAAKRGRLQFQIGKEFPTWTVAEVEAEAARRLEL